MSRSAIISLALVVGSVLMSESSNDVVAQRPGINQDESKVPAYDLPEVLVCSDGTRIESVAAWESKRRPELLKLFGDHVYGNVPSKNIEVEFSNGKSSWDVLEGKAERKEITIHFGPEKKITATLLLTIPKSEKPVPCFLGYNFNGNHTTTEDPQVSIPTSWVRGKSGSGANDHRATEQGRGQAASRWPYEEMVNRGFAVATIYYGDVDPDFDDQFQNGIQPLFYTDGQSKPDNHQWGSIGAWAWALSRALDYLESDDAIDGNHVAVIGHSRLGKTSLWAGATDQRFWLTISNDSGCGGAALHRRKFGETVKVINTNFPHWFCDQFVQYNDNENEIPVDQHQLMALIAPRGVYVASASLDLWADPKGEFLSLANADDVFELYGEKNLTRQFPPADEPIAVGSRGYHLRTGKHDITRFDWQQYCEFAKRRMRTE